MKNNISDKILQLAAEVNRDQTVSQRIRQIVDELQKYVKLEYSDKVLTTGSSYSKGKKNKMQNLDIQIVPFDLNLIENETRSCQIRIQDELFCDQDQEAQYLEQMKKQKFNKQNKDNFRCDLSPIKQDPQQNILESQKKTNKKSEIKRSTKSNLFKYKKFNYLAMAENGFMYTTL